MKFYLLINTVDFATATVGLANSSGKIVVSKSIASHTKRSTKVLETTTKLLAQRKVSQANIAGIIVAAGPGGFSSTRSGVVIANTLAWAWKIPVIGLKLKPSDDFVVRVGQAIKKTGTKKSSKIKFVVPIYNGEPNITIKKSKV